MFTCQVCQGPRTFDHHIFGVPFCPYVEEMEEKRRLVSLIDEKKSAIMDTLRGNVYMEKEELLDVIARLDKVLESSASS